MALATTASATTSYHGTLSATPGDHDVVTLRASGRVSVVNRNAAGEIYFTVCGTKQAFDRTFVVGNNVVPVAGAADTFVVLAGQETTVGGFAPDASTTEVKLASSTASLKYSVQSV